MTSNILIIASIIANFAGALGFLLSIYVFVVYRRDKRPRLNVAIGRSVAITQEADGLPPIELFYIDISNPSDRRIKVLSIQIEYVERLGFFRRRVSRNIYPHFQSEENFPFIMPTGDNTSFVSDMDEFSNWLTEEKVSGKIQVKAIINDATGNQYRSRLLIVDIKK